ncbi:MAG TPA: M20/M25/M40 family metallo-hydrolase [Cyclobacteriaceae bacterium]|jgi:putative aminopeptidase FrvX
MELKLLKDLCSISAASGSEIHVRDFILKYLKKHSGSWKKKPKILYGDEFQDCLILLFGKPRTAVFAHMDTVGFTVRYENQLIPVGGPSAENGVALVGRDALGEIQCKLKIDKQDRLYYDFGRAIERGTHLTFKPDFRETGKSVQCCSMDNRLGIYIALKVCEQLENGIIVFSAWEEHGGGSVPFLVKYIYENYKIRNYLVSDVTWVTDGVHPGKGTVISLRDQNIPRKKYLNQIIEIAERAGINYQLEVESSGSSDGREIQTSPYPLDWCFIGPAEKNVHSPDEKVNKKDILETIKLYKVLMDDL